MTNPKHRVENIKLGAIKAFSCMSDFTYISGPITTDLEALALPDSPARPLAEVIAKNRMLMREAARRVRLHIGGPVIAPCDFDEPLFAHRDYMDVWTVVVQQAAHVVFMVGWEFSEGACEEYVLALRHWKRCFSFNNESYSTLTPAKALESLIAADTVKDRKHWIARVEEHRASQKIDEYSPW